jgi:cytochrome c biogenesis protein CcdA
MSTAQFRHYRLPIFAGTVGGLTGLLVLSLLPVFMGYVKGVLGIVGPTSGFAPQHPGVLLSLGAAALIGLSMNFLPCNLPIVMSLLPAATHTDSRYGFLQKTVLYGLGAVLVLGTLGFVLGLFGETLRPLIVAYPASGVYVAVAVIGGVGFFSILWGLRELDLLALPSLPVSIGHTLREAVDTRDDAAGYILLGAVYGGTGGGCPLPTYHLLLLWVVITASPVYGAVLLSMYVLGRIAPIAILGALLRGHAIDVFSGKYDTLRRVNATVLIGGGSVLVVFTVGRALLGVA